jgi:hypothetical protein
MNRLWTARSRYGRIDRPGWTVSACGRRPRKASCSRSSASTPRRRANRRRRAPRPCGSDTAPRMRPRCRRGPLRSDPHRPRYQSSSCRPLSRSRCRERLDYRRIAQQNVDSGRCNRVARDAHHRYTQHIPGLRGACIGLGERGSLCQRWPSRRQRRRSRLPCYG